ncbi:flagellar biosynthesis protein FlgM [Streptomyces cinnamoneus]|uniref:Neutral metalloproteinase n=1 Tax=Streptomyces cinnamoneus TaxID=53446 RepID=A0A2G1XL01_STRCJ|nr:M4 family metallopeptidase [Streptomyces cinnamoneus]PHQ51851.1 flagellar biosynthesis protein FlgM [Streptomyces cinnamoneus]PPT16315.1 peptidase M4 [Streptomyces cinnamoneus]
MVGTAAAAPSPAARTTASSPAGADVVKAARAAALAHAKDTGVGSSDTLKVRDTLVDPEGKRHVRFERSHQGVAVIGGDLVVHLDAENTYLGVTRAIGHQVTVPTVTPKLTAGQAADKAAESAKGTANKTQLVVDARTGDGVLAYQVTVTGGAGTETGAAHSVVVDATSGKVISSTPLSDAFISPKLKSTLRGLGQTAAPGTAAKPGTPAPAKPATGAFPAPANGTGASIFAGGVPLITTQTAKSTFVLKDPSRGNGETRNAGRQELETFASGKQFTDADNKWGNGTSKDAASAAVDAQYGITSTFDYYKKTFGRNGIANDGVGPHALVHFGNNVGNAFWSPDCACMLYGDGDGETFKQPLVALDVTGHELSHGVIEATANFQPTRVDGQGNQYGEAGSLNESLADIFGTGVEFGTNNAVNPPNYLLGEKLGLEQKFLRRLDKPSLDKLEGTVDYWDEGSYDREVHAGSGVSSHAFYLLAEGSGRKTVGGVTYDSPTHDGQSVTGIGRAKAEQIFYRALTRYMVSTTDFHEARTATLQAAADVYGAGSTEYKTVDAAWAAVNVTQANTPAPKG